MAGQYLFEEMSLAPSRSHDFFHRDSRHWVRAEDSVNQGNGERRKAALGEEVSLHLAPTIGLPVSGKKDVNDSSDAPDSEWLGTEKSVLEEFDGPVVWSSTGSCVAGSVAASTSEVDQADLEGVWVDEDVLVFDVAVADAGAGEFHAAGDQLAGDDANSFLVDCAVLVGEFEEVNVAIESLHDKDEGRSPLVPVKRSDDEVGCLGRLEVVVDLARDGSVLNLFELGDLVSWNLLDDDSLPGLVVEACVDDAVGRLHHFFLDLVSLGESSLVFGDLFLRRDDVFIGGVAGLAVSGHFSY